MKRDLTSIVKDILSVGIDAIEGQYPVYPHKVERLYNEFNNVMKDSDLTHLVVSINNEPD